MQRADVVADAAVAVPKSAGKAVEKVASVEPLKSARAGDRFWLQAGSFTDQADAENLKAQLALGGWQAAVQQGVLADKSVRYRVRLGPYEHLVLVKALSARRGPAAVAAELYQERPESVAAREALALQLKTLHAAFVPEKGRPTKRDRREIERLKGRG